MVPTPRDSFEHAHDFFANSGAMWQSIAGSRSATEKNGGQDAIFDAVGWEPGARPSEPAKTSGCGVDEFEDDEESEGGIGTEHTGRWSNEEHELFLRGLELYGKGWKKIAQLIKTRTVVQIRTHAQKYFQKLTKAKACPADPGSASADKPASSSACRAKGGRKRSAGGGRRDRVVFQNAGPGRVAVAPSLKPYLALPGVGGSVEVGLYRFLSPAMIDGKAPVELQSEVAAAAAAEAKAQEAGGSPAPAPTRIAQAPAPAETTKPVPETSTSGGGPVLPSKLPVRLPEWYAHGAGMTALLAQAESVDWAADTGGDAIPLSGKASPTKTRPPHPVKVPLAFPKRNKASKEPKAKKAKKAPSDAPLPLRWSNLDLYGAGQAEESVVESALHTGPSIENLLLSGSASDLAGFDDLDNPFFTPNEAFP